MTHEQTFRSWLCQESLQRSSFIISRGHQLGLVSLGGIGATEFSSAPGCWLPWAVLCLVPLRYEKAWKHGRSPTAAVLPISVNVQKVSEIWAWKELKDGLLIKVGLWTTRLISIHTAKDISRNMLICHAQPSVSWGFRRLSKMKSNFF